MTTMIVTSPAPVAVPRGAAWGAHVAARVLSFFAGLIDRRAEHAERSSIAVDAAYVRRLADEVRSMDPRFAADLYAAADRHEMN